MAEDLAAVQAVVFELVGDPGVARPDAAERVELEARVDVEVVKVDGRLQRHRVGRKLALVIDLVELCVGHEQVDRRLEGGKQRVVLEHEGEGRLAGEHERACRRGKLRAREVLVLGRPADGLLERAVGVDELLEHPVQRVARRGEALQRAHEEGISELRFVTSAGQ